MLRFQGRLFATLLSLLLPFCIHVSSALSQEGPKKEEERFPVPSHESPLPEEFTWIRPEGGSSGLLSNINPFGVPARVVTSLTVTGEYDDNVKQTERDRKGDYFMQVSPGIGLNFISPRVFLTLGYSTSLTLYNRFYELNTLSPHGLAVAAGGRPTRNLSIAVTDSFTRSTNIGDSLGLTRGDGQDTFTRNSVTPQVEYIFSKELRTVLQYNNTLVRNRSENQDDSAINSARGNLRYTYGPGSFFEAGYEQTRANFTISPDFTGHEVDATLAHAFDRLTTVTLASTYFLEDRRGPNENPPGRTSDRVLSRTTLGVRRRLTPRLTGSLSGGVGIFDIKGGEYNVRPDVRSRLEWASPFFSAAVGCDYFFSQTFSEVENVGTTLTQRGSVSFRYLFTPELLGRTTGTYSRVKFLEDTGVEGSIPGRIDDVISANVDISYRLLKWLFFTIGYDLFKRESNQQGFDLLSNRFRISVTTEYSL